MSPFVNRRSIYTHRRLIPKPRGCEDCGLLRGSFGSLQHVFGPCQHDRHFENIKKYLLGREFCFLDAGQTRSTYVRRNSKVVYKVPQNDDGYRDNYLEALAWKERANFYAKMTHETTRHYIGHRIARCRLHPSGVLVMERLEQPQRWYWRPMTELNELDPSTVGDPAMDKIFQVDEGQGGLGTDGRWKLYDYTHQVEIKDPTADMFAL